MCLIVTVIKDIGGKLMKLWMEINLEKLEELIGAMSQRTCAESNLILVCNLHNLPCGVCGNNRRQQKVFTDISLIFPSTSLHHSLIHQWFLPNTLQIQLLIQVCFNLRIWNQSSDRSFGRHSSGDSAQISFIFSDALPKASAST